MHDLQVSLWVPGDLVGILPGGEQGPERKRGGGGASRTDEGMSLRARGR